MAGNDGARGELARVVVLIIGIVGLLGLAIAAPIWILSEDIGLPSIDLGGSATPDASEEVASESGSGVEAPPTTRAVSADDLMRVTVGPDAATTTTTAAPTTTTTTVPLRDESTGDWLLQPSVEPPTTTTTTTIERQTDPVIADLLVRVERDVEFGQAMSTESADLIRAIHVELPLGRRFPITDEERAELVTGLEILAERYAAAFDVRVDASVQTPIGDTGWGPPLSGAPSRPSFAIEGDDRVAFVGVGGERLGYVDAPLETFEPLAVPIDQLRPEFSNRTPVWAVDLGLHVRPDGELMIERVDLGCGIPQGLITVGFRPEVIDAPFGLEISAARTRVIDPFDPDLEALAVTPLGWLPDDRAALMIDVRVCGGGPVADDRNGVYLLDDGAFELVVPVTGRRVWLLDPTRG